MRLLLAFGNKARHGKDSAAQAIKNWRDEVQMRIDKTFEMTGFSQPDFHPEVRVLKFATALYDICRKEYGMTEKDAPLLQRVGQEKRQENPRYWIDRLFFSIGKFDGIGIITDVRYRNEAEEIKARGGFLINVTRMNADGTPFVADDRPANHPSETELDGWNWDAYIRTHTGDEALAAELACTYAQYFLGVTEPRNV